MNQIAVSAYLEYRVAAPTTFVFSVLPAVTKRQTVVVEELSVTPSWRLDTDGQRRLIRTQTTGATSLVVDLTATVEVAPRRANPVDLDQPAVDDLPAHVLDDLAPSRYCQSDRLGRFAQRVVGDAAPGYERIRAISDWVGKQLDYVPGVSDATTTALDTMIERAGVCRDFAHLAIALCRAVGTPARYVAGYGVGVEPPDFHGFFEAYIGSDWYLFDPTGMTPTDGLVRIAHGRDAGDTPFATMYGDATLESQVVTVTEYAESPDEGHGDNDPASTA